MTTGRSGGEASVERWCSAHPTLVTEYWCQQDQVPVCQHCFIFSPHKSLTAVTNQQWAAKDLRVFKKQSFNLQGPVTRRPQMFTCLVCKVTLEDETCLTTDCLGRDHKKKVVRWRLQREGTSNGERGRSRWQGMDRTIEEYEFSNTSVHGPPDFIVNLSEKTSESLGEITRCTRLVADTRDEERGTARWLGVGGPDSVVEPKNPLEGSNKKSDLGHWGRGWTPTRCPQMR